MNYPELVSAYKAAVVRGMTHWASDFLKEQMGSGPRSDTRAYCMYCIAKFQVLVDQSPAFMSPAVALDAANYVRMHLLFYQQLAVDNRARDDGVKNYKIVPKHHACLHLADYVEQTRRNPRSPG